jgi:predicted nucleotidyltransferase
MMNNIHVAQKPLSDILQTLKALKGIARTRYKAELKGVFGSYVRGEQKTGSDLDVLAEFDTGANLIDLIGLSYFLEEKLGCSVDVVPESALRAELKPGILKEAVSV